MLVNSSRQSRRASRQTAVHSASGRSASASQWEQEVRRIPKSPSYLISVAVCGALASAAMLCVAPGNAGAATAVNVQFDQGSMYSGTAAAPDTGTFWNQINTSNTNNGGTLSGSGLTASDGTTVTTIGFTLTGGDLFGGAPAFGSNNNGTDNSLLQNFVVGGPFPKADSTAESLTISGLDPGAAYNIYFYGSKNPGADSTLTIGSSTVATNGAVVNAATPFDAADQGHEWNVIDGVVANGSGSLVGYVGTGSDAGYAAINGFQILPGSPALTWDSSGYNPTAPTDGAGIWNTTSTNWSNGTADVAWNNSLDSGSPVSFGANNGTAGAVTLGANIQAGGLTFNPATSGQYTIVGSGSNTLELTGPSIVANTSATLAVNTIFDQGLTLTGNNAAALTLTGNNTFDAPINVISGTLWDSTNNGAGIDAGSANAPNITIGNNATLQVGPANTPSSLGFSANYNNAITLGGNGQPVGPSGALYTTSDNATFTFKGALTTENTGDTLISIYAANTTTPSAPSAYPTA